LDGKHRLRRIVRVSEGTLTNAMVHPREVYAPALRDGAAALIAVHNHPSGDPEPSEDDVRVTKRLVDTGVMVGVPLLDHVVVATGGWVSLRERLRWEG
jgi:DNA repair protein RadC